MSEVKKCPNCGGDMDSGFLISPRPLWWDTKKHSGIADGEKLLSFSWRMYNLDAHRCSKCKLVLFSYGKESQSSQKT